MNVAQNLETFCKFAMFCRGTCGRSQGWKCMRPRRNRSIWKKFEWSVFVNCENCDRLLLNYNCKGQHIHYLAHPGLHSYITTSRQRQATRAAEISCLIKSRTCCWGDLVCCNGDSQPGFCQGCVTGIHQPSGNCDCNKLPYLSNVCPCLSRVSQAAMCYIWHEFPESSFPRAPLSVSLSCPPALNLFPFPVPCPVASELGRAEPGTAPLPWLSDLQAGAQSSQLSPAPLSQTTQLSPHTSDKRETGERERSGHTLMMSSDQVIKLLSDQTQS